MRPAVVVVGAGCTCVMAGVDLERKPFTFLYRQGNILYLMVPDTFEQLEVDAKLMSDPKEMAYIKENDTVWVEMNGDKMLRVMLPASAIAQVWPTHVPAVQLLTPLTALVGWWWWVGRSNSPIRLS
jgi:hypothetical protein